MIEFSSRLNNKGENMEKVLKKLGFKEGMASSLENIPDYLRDELVNIVGEDLKEAGPYDFTMYFCLNLEDLKKDKERLHNNLNNDSRLWIVYPKKSSKKYRSNLSRDILWGEFGEFGMEPVSNFAVDEDWSAIRFRKVEDIGRMKRKVFSSKEGKEKYEKNLLKEGE